MNQMQNSSPANDRYLTAWDPRSYLRQFYSTFTVPDDTRAVIQFLYEQLKLRNVRGGRALEFGCGPTIWGALPLAAFLDEIHLADYLSTNLNEVRRWLDGAADAHDWSVYQRYVLVQEGNHEPTVQEIAHRGQFLRERVAALCLSDIHRTPAVATPVPDYDVVTSFYCLDCIQPDIGLWRTFMRRLSSLVAPGGHLLLASILGSREYFVEGKTFPVTPLQGSDFREILIACGFREDTIVIREVPINDWKDEGFDQIALVAASR